MTDAPRGEPTIQVLPDATAVADAAAAAIGEALRGAVERHGRAHWATTGGSSPVGIYRSIVGGPLRTSVPWERVDVWWGDDRYVPRDHPLSNVKPFDDIMVGIGGLEEGTAGQPVPGVAIPAANVHPFPTTEAIGRALGASWCAATLADELRAAGPRERDSWPAFDLLLIGVGSDGHLLSVFPGSPALHATELALAIPAPTHIAPHVERVTLNPAVVAAADAVLVVVNGSDKADAIRTIFGAWDPDAHPAQLARRTGATWLIGADAAAGLPR